MSQSRADHSGIFVRQLFREAGLGALAGFLGLGFINVRP
jgi:hypothetical protein